MARVLSQRARLVRAPTFQPLSILFQNSSHDVPPGCHLPIQRSMPPTLSRSHTRDLSTSLLDMTAMLVLLSHQPLAAVAAILPALPTGWRHMPQPHLWHRLSPDLQVYGCLFLERLVKEKLSDQCQYPCVVAANSSLTRLAQVGYGEQRARVGGGNGCFSCHFPPAQLSIDAGVSQSPPPDSGPLAWHPRGYERET